MSVKKQTARPRSELQASLLAVQCSSAWNIYIYPHSSIGSRFYAPRYAHDRVSGPKYVTL
eukprot:1136985-Pelagomonas_calceolata.AAC.3